LSQGKTFPPWSLERRTLISIGSAGKAFSQISLTAGLTTRRPLVHLLHLVPSEYGEAKFQVNAIKVAA
jgi:hypothetical protein